MKGAIVKVSNEWERCNDAMSEKEDVEGKLKGKLKERQKVC
jgi:hypothetical protein